MHYGYDLGFEENVPGDIDVWVPVDRKAGLTGEELKKENDFRKVRRRSCIAWVFTLNNGRTLYSYEDQKLGNWFLHCFTGKRLHSGGALNTILKQVQAMTGNSTRPRRKLNVTVYSGKYYATKLKVDFDMIWENAKETMPPSTRISMCQESQDYVKSWWEAESEEIKAEFAVEAGTLHVEVLKEYNDCSIIPEGSAQDYHQ
jgi:hypothetical protein